MNCPCKHMGRKGDAVTARERSAQPSPVSPLFALHRPFYSLFRRNPLGRKEGRFRPKGGAYSLPSRARVWETVFRGGEVCRLPLSLPLPSRTHGGGEAADYPGQGLCRIRPPVRIDTRGRRGIALVPPCTPRTGVSPSLPQITAGRPPETAHSPVSNSPCGAL